MDVKNLKNRFDGERAFIIGNGLSLRYAPFVALMEEFTFATNRIALIFPFVAWRPSFFTLVTDGVWIQEYRDSYETGLRESTRANFINIDNKRVLTYNPGAKNIYLDCKDTNAAWSDDPSEWVSRWGTSSIVSIQMAAYMGFNPINLLGFDLGFKPQLASGIDVCHFSTIYGGEYQYDRARRDKYDRTYYECLITDHIRTHELARMNIQRLGIDVFNVGIGGELEVYPRRSIWEALA